MSVCELNIFLKMDHHYLLFSALQCERDFFIQIFLYWHFKCSKSAAINPILPVPLFNNKYLVLFPYYPEITFMMMLSPN